MKTRPLTSDDIAALRAVKDGGDVFDYGIARRLRQISRERPELIEICEAQGDYGDGSNREPYFGAILTTKGREVAA